MTYYMLAHNWLAQAKLVQKKQAAKVAKEVAKLKEIEDFILPLKLSIEYTTVVHTHLRNGYSVRQYRKFNPDRLPPKPDWLD